MTRRLSADLAVRRMRRLERALASLTETRKSEDLLRRRSEIVLAQVADVAVAVLIANDHARFIDANRAAVRATGYSRSELLAMNVWDLTPTPRRVLGRRLWREFLHRGRMRGRYQLRHKHGQVVTFRYIAVANVLPGIHVSALAVPGQSTKRARPPSR